ncbi:MAG: MarR family winged helix-turn-helix transcriptional regulator [Patescibacteria group bacterium]
MVDSDKTRELFMDIAYKIHGLVMLMDKDAEKFLQKELELSYNQFLIIFAISEHCAKTQKSVAFFTNLTEAAVSKQIENLRKSGYMTRVESSEDRREHILSLTSKGSEKANKAKSLIYKNVKKLFSVLNTAQLTDLHTHLDKLFQKITHNSKYFNH